MTARNTNRARIQAADLASKRKPASSVGDELRVHMLLHVPPRERTVVLPEPVVVPAMVNGRALRGWERVLYREAMQRERRAELALFRGLIA